MSFDCPLCAVSVLKLQRHLHSVHRVGREEGILVVYGRPRGGPFELEPTVETLHRGNGEMKRLVLDPLLGEKLDR